MSNSQQEAVSTKIKLSPSILYLYSLLGIIAFSMVLAIGYFIFKIFR
jgi:hypothetical protein